MSDQQFPEGWCLVPDRSLQQRLHGQMLLGGVPFRVLRLTPAGATLAKRWFAGETVAGSPATQSLASRFVASGVAHPRPAPASPTAITIVIPVKDDEPGLAATLTSLGASDSADLQIIVVDDGSEVPVVVPDLDAPRRTHATIELIRNDTPLGPGPARNVGFTSSTSDVVAFVDAGVTIPESGLQQLASYLSDPQICAVAPRVRSVMGDQPTSLERYERAHSPLDLGPDECSVEPGSRVAYVPTACLVVRAESLRALDSGPDPFDPTLRYGEDVDLIWRLGATGTVRYVPHVEAQHPPRDCISAFVRQRVGYGSSAAPLSTRHGTAVAPFRTSLAGSGLLSLLAIRKWSIATLALGALSYQIYRKLGAAVPDREVQSTRLAVTGHGFAARALGDASIRVWWPLTLAGVFIPGLRKPARTLLALGLGSNIWTHRTESGIKSKAVQSALGLLDGFSYGLGVWKGSFAEKSAAALLPDVHRGD